MAIPSSSNDQAFNDSLTNTTLNYIEMKGYIDELNELKDKYATVNTLAHEYAAAYNEQKAIFNEHAHELSISSEDIKQRVDKAVDTALGKLKK